jgi:hypothetical protein
MVASLRGTNATDVLRRSCTGIGADSWTNETSLALASSADGARIGTKRNPLSEHTEQHETLDNRLDLMHHEEASDRTCSVQPGGGLASEA